MRAPGCEDLGRGCCLALAEVQAADGEREAVSETAVPGGMRTAGLLVSGSSPTLVTLR